MNRIHLPGLFSVLLWSGAALSVSGFFAGAAAAPLGALKGTLAVLTGSFAGCIVLFSAGYAAAGCSQQDRSALQEHRRHSLQKEDSGVSGLLLSPDFRESLSGFFLLLSLFYLLLRSIFLLRTGISAAYMEDLSLSHHLSSSSCDPIVYDCPYCVLPVFLMAAVCLFRFVPRHFRLAAAVVLFLLTAGSAVVLLLKFPAYERSVHSVFFPAGRMSFPDIAKNSAMLCISWAPAFYILTETPAGFSGEDEKPVRFPAAGAASFFFSGILIQLAGLSFSCRCHISLLPEILLSAELKPVWQTFCILSSVTVALICLFSAQKSSVTIFYEARSGVFSALLLLLTAAVSLTVPARQAEFFMRLFSEYFVPVLTAAAAAGFALKRIRRKKADVAEITGEMISMKIDKRYLRLYAVTERSGLKGCTLAEAVEDAIRGGVTMVQLREKELPDGEFLALAEEIKSVTDRYGIPLIINDRPDIALKCGAAGVHIGQGDGSVEEARRLLGESSIIGVSAHNEEEALTAEKSGADYLGAGAVFSTSTKKDANDVPIEQLSRICEAVSIPVVAIGGITSENTVLLKDTGIAGIAAVSALFSEEDPGAAAVRLTEALTDIGISPRPSAPFEKLEIKGAIFDVDGTILDSMPMWCSLGSRFLIKNGAIPAEDIDSQMVSRTLEESAAIFSETYGIPGTIEEIVAGMIDMVRDNYLYHLTCKPGADTVIKELAEKGIPLYIATATDREMIEAAMERLGLAQYFKGIITCGELGMPKTKPDIYYYAADMLGTRPEETLVFEDAAHGIRTASFAGFPTISIYDKDSASSRKVMELMSVLYLDTYSDWPGI